MTAEQMTAYATTPVSAHGISCADLDWLDSIGILWMLELDELLPLPITQVVVWDEWQLQDLREAGINCESDSDFLKKRSIVPDLEPAEESEGI